MGVVEKELFGFSEVLFYRPKKKKKKWKEVRVEFCGPDK
jgi:hypothetical protein